MQVSSESSVFALPTDVWSVIFKYIHVYDTIFLRASSKQFKTMCKQFRPFPRYYVLDQDELMIYLVENGAVSCLDYVKHALHFEWRRKLCPSAAQCGQVEVLKHLRAHGCPFDERSILLQCTKGTCDINMIKYLHESGVPWEQEDCVVHSLGYFNRDNTVQTVMENMAFHGHLDCMKYALQNGCNQKQVWYTPSTECLDFAIENNFIWQGGEGSRAIRRFTAVTLVKLSICEEAARLGDLKMLQYAHQKGALLNDSAPFAARGGFLDCFKYAVESAVKNGPPIEWRRSLFNTPECFKYALEVTGLEVLRGQADDLWCTAAKISVECLQLLLDNHIPVPTTSFFTQALLDSSSWSIEILKFVLDTVKLPLTHSPLAACAVHGNVELLKFVAERYMQNEEFKTPAEIERTISSALFSKNVDALKFVWEMFPNKEGINLNNCYINAAQMSVPEILNFLTEQGTQWTSEHLNAAFAGGNLPNMAYLVRMGWQSNWNEY